MIGILLCTIVFIALVFWYDNLAYGLAEKGLADVSHLSKEEIRLIDENRIKGAGKSDERIRLELLLFNYPGMEKELMGDIKDLNEDEIKKELRRLSWLVREKGWSEETREVTQRGTLRPRQGYSSAKPLRKGSELEIKK